MRRVMEDRPLDPVTMVHVVERDNVLSAWKQVRANKGGTGIDNMFPEYAHEKMKHPKVFPKAGRCHLS